MFFPDNIKFLRKRKKISQSYLAEELNINRSTLAGYEKNVQPPYAVLIEISNYFKISIDALLKYNLSILNEFQLSEIEKGFDADISGKQIRLLTISVDSDNNENIELVPLKAQAGYTQSHADKEFIEKLDRFKLPFLDNNKTYRCFQIKGDSMPPIKENSWLTCSYIQDWKNIKNGTACIIITKSDGIVFKLVYNHIQSDNLLQLVSTNREYSPYNINISEITEIWKFETFNGFEI
ncbi:MAG: helix-turn-helix domain-containing protein [Marinifilaceae bacterium]|jgi:transcriptional regulator with XRE-family HTH domain|nr:helix-turn-helix domain-containing protein [Marinifilaceae bacterium]